MGAELSCPCSSRIGENDSLPKFIPDLESLNLKPKLEDEDIIFTSTYHFTKLYLIKTSNLEKFFNCRSVLKLNNKKEVYNQH